MRSSFFSNTCPEAVVNNKIFPYLSATDFTSLSVSSRLFDRLFKTSISKTSASDNWIKQIEQLILPAKASPERIEMNEEKSSSSQPLGYDAWKKLPTAILIQVCVRLERMLHANIQIELIHVFSAAGNIELLRNYLLTQGFASEKDLTDERYLQGEKIPSGTHESHAYFNIQDKLKEYFKEAARCAPLNVLQQFIEKWGLRLDESIYTNAAKSNAVKECGYLSEQFINRNRFYYNYPHRKDFETECLPLTLSNAIAGNNFSLVRHCVEINNIKLHSGFLSVALQNDRLEIFKYLCAHLQSEPPVRKILEESLYSKKGDIFSHYIKQLTTFDPKREFNRNRDSLLTKAAHQDNAAATKVLMEMMEMEKELSTSQKLSLRNWLCTYCLPRMSDNTFRCLMTPEFSRTHGESMLRGSIYRRDLSLVKFLVEERGVIPSQATIEFFSKESDTRAYLELSVKTRVSPAPTEGIAVSIAQQSQTLFAAPSIINETPTLNGPIPAAGLAIRPAS